MNKVVGFLIGGAALATIVLAARELSAEEKEETPTGPLPTPPDPNAIEPSSTVQPTMGTWLDVPLVMGTCLTSGQRYRVSYPTMGTQELNEVANVLVLFGAGKPDKVYVQNDIVYQEFIANGYCLQALETGVMQATGVQIERHQGPLNVNTLIGGLGNG